MTKLKIGLLLDSYDVQAWIYHAIEQVFLLDFTEISLVVLKVCAAKTPLRQSLRIYNKEPFVYQLLNSLDKKIFIRENNAFINKRLEKFLIGTPIIEVIPAQDSDFEIFPSNVTEQIRNAKLDILVQIGFNDLKGDILTSTEYGVWSYRFGEDRNNNSNPPGFWEVAENKPETCASLINLSKENILQEILYASHFQTFPFSFARNQNQIFWGASSFLVRQIKLLHYLRENAFNKEIEKYNKVFNFYDHRKFKALSNLQAIWFYIRLFARVLRVIMNQFFYREQWCLFFNLSNSSSFSFYNFMAMIPPKEFFWADPHILLVNNKYFIFLEEYSFKNKKGHISVIEMDQNGSYEKPKQILTKKYHLSYPFVFEWKGKYYMIPETAEKMTIELYECVEFPNQWEFKMNLMENVIAVDTTLFFDEENWWLFTGIAETEGFFPNVELFLFHSKELFSNIWTSHPLNPIVSDDKKARPAGKIFIKDNKIYRPSQDCSKHYGYGFDLNEITQLSDREYSEKTIIQVRPNWNRKIESTHTFSHLDQITMIDCCKKRRKIL